MTPAVTSSLPDDITVQPQATPINKIPIYRAAKYQGGYFYTADLAEYKTAVNFDMRLESGPNGESPAFYATDASTPGALPVHRSAKLTGDGYFYTVSEYEHSITPQNNMRQETFTFYAMPTGSQMYDEIPMYRGAHLPNHGNGNEGYIYTADLDEYNNALPANGYRQESEVFRVFGDGGAVTPTPPAPAAPARLSTDNITFADTVTNFAGGDLIIKEDPSTAAFSSTSYSDYTIKIGGVTCTTTGQGYVADGGAASGNVPEIGCVIPKLTSAGIYEVKVDVTDLGPEKVGELNYQALPTTFNANCGTMQAFGTNSECKTKLPQGQSVLLQDTRGGADIGFGANNYRVKKMPDGNVWQIDNLAYTPTNTDFPNTAPVKVTCATYPSTTCTSSKNYAPQWTDGAYDTGKSWNDGYGDTTNYADHSYGYLYNWCAAVADTSAGCATSLAETGTGLDGTQGLAPTGWKLPTGSSSGQFYTLNTKMTDAATNGNPVYNTDAQQNYRDNTTSDKNNPYQGVYSGYYIFALFDQGAGGYGVYWSSTADSGSDAWDLNVYFGLVDPGTNTDNKEDGFALRAVL